MISRLAAPSKTWASLEGLLQKVLDLEPPSELKRYLGCNRVVRSVTVRTAEMPWNQIPGIPPCALGNEAPAKIVEYEMKGFVDQGLEQYVNLLAKRGRHG